MSKTNEQELVKACVKGDAKAQKNLYDQYSRVMFGICLRYTGNYEEAKDVLQDGFIKVFTKIGQFSFSGSLEGWMKRVFVNTALEHYRSQKHYMMQSDIEAADAKLHEDYTVEQISRKEILAAMNKLAPGYRNVLNLYVIDGYSHAEIGEMLNISEGTSKSQLSRARVILQQELSKQEKAIK
jgi:RNA polymerase sigma-70 factor (ECF subfamily)